MDRGSPRRGEFMSMYHTGLVTGFVCVFLVVAVVAAVYRKTRTGVGRGEYDERQVLLRGRGMKYAYFTLLLTESIYTLAFMDDTRKMVDPVLVNMGLILVSALVLAGYTIFTDAYWGFQKKNRAGLFLLWFLCTVSMLLNGLSRLDEKKIIVKGQLTFDGGIPFLTLGFLGVFFIMLLIKSVMDRKGGEEV